MNEEKDLFYRPDIKIEQNYYSEGKFEKQIPVQEEEQKVLESDELLAKADEIINKLTKIHGILPFLPEKLYKILKDLVEKLTFQAIIEENAIKRQQIIDNEEEEDKYVDKYESSPEEDIGTKIEMEGDLPITDDVASFLNELGPSGLSIEVVKVRSNSRLAHDQYVRDSLYIKEDFVKNMNFALSQYIYPLLNVMSESGVNKIEYLNYDYDAPSVNGISPDLQHLNDMIVRTQVTIEEKINLMQKTHGIKETSSAIMAFDTAAKERIRYYSEDYDIGMKQYSDIYKNKFLTQSRSMYDAKYAKTKTNMYKYLNSAVINTTEILKESLASGISKCHLLSKGINIFEHKEYDSQGYTNSVGNGSAEFTGNQATKQEAGERSKGSLLDKVKEEVKI